MTFESNGGEHKSSQYCVIQFILQWVDLKKNIAGNTCDDLKAKLESSLRRLLSRFGLKMLKDEQRTALYYLLYGNYVFVNLAIGFGKRLILLAPLNECSTAFVGMLGSMEGINSFGPLSFPKFRTS